MLKFSKRDEQSELFETSVAIDNDRRSVPVVNGTFDPICLTECPRRIMYRTLGISHNAIKSDMRRRADTATINKWLGVFKDSFKINFIDQDLPLADSKFNITGKLHAMIKIDNTLFATQIKSVSCEDFTNIKQQGALKKDVVEMIVYLWMLEVTDGLIVYDNNNNGDYLAFHIEPYNPIINSVRKKCERMMQAKMNGGLVERPYEDGSSSECKTCEFLDKCWNSKRDK